MAQDPDTIYKILRIVPEFDGNPNVLTRFINICDQIVTQYLNNTPGSELTNLCLLNGILNKITGTAAATLNSNGIPDNWLGIRTSLINNFSDQRDETALYNDLSLAVQGNKTPQEFYSHCQTLFSTIMTYVTLHETLTTTIEAKRDLYRKVTMQAFVRGLKEPLGSRIRCMRPETIEKALEYVQEELNVTYLQQRTDGLKQQTIPKVHPVQFLPPRSQNFQPPMINWPTPVGQRPIQPPQPFRFNFTRNQPQHNMPMHTRTQQMFSAPPPNYNPRSNVFRLPPRNNPSQNSMPKPMSGIQNFNPRPLPHTSMTGHDWRKFGNPPPTNYLKSREMNMNECLPYEDMCYNYQDYCYEPEYNYYSEHDDYNTNYRPDFCNNNSISYYETNDDRLISDTEPQSDPSCCADQDFRLDPKSPKPK